MVRSEDRGFELEVGDEHPELGREFDRIEVIDLAGRSTLADYMVVATGTSQRHLASMADKLVERLKQAGHGGVAVEGEGDTGWVLIDAGDVIVHLFRAETRAFYELEKLWTMTPPTP